MTECVPESLFSKYIQRADDRSCTLRNVQMLYISLYRNPTGKRDILFQNCHTLVFFRPSTQTKTPLERLQMLHKEPNNFILFRQHLIIPLICYNTLHVHVWLSMSLSPCSLNTSKELMTVIEQIRNAQMLWTSL